MAALNIAFDAPDNSRTARPSKSRPIDLVHLATQTAGDKNLEADVLHLFARQARTALGELANADTKGVKATAHRLRGAASAVGAFEVARLAGEVEEKPADVSLKANLAAAVLDAENFILKLSR
ncbi:Hpt domain-containing protein [Rhizobiaceae bacterium BDR2-2]|uniref:Hpt domain-containing protein n=1 Tax=Ectorhizobium quercum TaxID=2965071 RepID=A0AAE3SW14_9HYPH|nr:Hpt domain-containing protein [Ectorhizobium quercum]MCX8997539.1 Hpt domain-containing protein [Ectorhizobium quercum]